MHDVLEQLLGYLRGIWRYRWMIVIVAFIGSLAGWAVVVQLPDRYTASARVYVDTQSVLKPLLSGLAVDTNPQRKVFLMTRTLRSRPNLEKIARMADLDINVTTPEDMEALLNELEENIALGGAGRGDLYTLSYTDSDPRLAKLVVQSVLTLFVESNIGESRQDTDSAQRFIEQEIKEYEQRLIEAEERKKDFKRKNLGLLPGQGGGYYSRLSKAKGRLRDAQLELEISKDLVIEMERQLEGEEPVFGIARPKARQLGNPKIQRIDARIASLEQRIDELLLQYTEEYPDILIAKQTIAALQKEREVKLDELVDEELATGASGIEPALLDANPVYQQLRLSYASAQADLTAKRVRVKEFERRVTELQTLVDTVPQVEAELQRLDRDYSINKQNYESLLARRESARLAERVETSTDGVKFRVIDPPRVPLEPSEPNRPLLMTLALFASILLGGALAFVVSQVRAVFDSRNNLERITGVAVLGEVTAVATQAQQVRQRLGAFAYAASWALLIAVFGALVTLHIYYANPIKELLG